MLAVAQEVCCSEPDKVATYSSSRTDGLVPPVTVNDGRNLALHPPSPFHQPLRDLLSAYTHSYESLKTIIPLLDLWVHSHGVSRRELTPNCLALMLLGCLQDQKAIATLQSAATKGRTSKHTMESTVRDGGLVNHNTAHSKSHTTVKKLPPLGQIVADFFRYGNSLNDSKFA